MKGVKIFKHPMRKKKVAPGETKTGMPRVGRTKVPKGYLSKSLSSARKRLRSS